MTIKGKMQYIDLETGYWAIVSSTEQYRLTNVPDELKKNGLLIEADIEIIDNEMSVFMSGTAIKLINYKILS